MLYPILLCGFAGLSTALGGLVVILSGGIDNKKMSLSQGFAAGVMLSVSVMDLLPESYGHYFTYMPGADRIKAVFSLFAAGWVIGTAISGVALPKTKGKKQTDIETVSRMAVVTTAVMVLHNLPEGVLTMFTSSRDLNFGLRMSIAVALHNMPEGMAIASPVYYVSKSKAKAFLLTLWAGMAELAGGVAAYLIASDFLTPSLVNGLMPVIAGIMCRAAVEELIPAGVKLSKFKHTFYGILCGIILISIGLFVF